ncbi:hypothetical protein HK405_001651 [Cladochytrium tenue]|nr:hypothetical protein HK405_001651 [Cladochytrium tenue]
MQYSNAGSATPDVVEDAAAVSTAAAAAPTTTLSYALGSLPASISDDIEQNRVLVPLVHAADSLEEDIEQEGTLADATYFLPADGAERKRLHVQHIVFRHLFAGLFHTPQQALLEDPSAAAKVLDMGCGPGSWTLEMAAKFPHAEFIGGVTSLSE